METFIQVVVTKNQEFTSLKVIKCVSLLTNLKMHFKKRKEN